MKTCDFCGNPVAEHLKLCPYCNHTLSFSKQPSKSTQKTVEVINLEAGRPFVKEALERFGREFTNIQNRPVGLLKIIHGYGSSGKGGKIKIALRQKLKLMLAGNIIKNVIKGESYSKSTNSAVYPSKLVEAYPNLLEFLHADKYNPGITFIEL